MPRAGLKTEADDATGCGKFIRKGDADCEHCSLRGSTLFADIGNELGQLATKICSGVLRRGAVIYSAKDPGNDVFTIRVGLVKLVMDVPGREGRIVRLLGRGAALGLETLTGSPYDHTATTLRTTSLCRIPIPTVERLHARNPDLLYGLMAKWHEQVMGADQCIAILGSGPVPQRLANLVRLLVDIGGDPLDEVQLPQVAEIAAVLGVSHESASRHLAELKRRGLLVRVAPHTYRCDPGLFLVKTDGAPPPQTDSGEHSSSATTGAVGAP
jgi:CRP-like cAMP-binding protein